MPSQAAASLVSRLAAGADSGTAVNIAQLAGELSFAVVSKAAFGCVCSCDGGFSLRPAAACTCLLQSAIHRAVPQHTALRERCCCLTMCCAGWT